MIDYILLVASILSDLFACGILRNRFCKKYIKHQVDLQMFNAASSAVSAAAVAGICLCTSGISMPSMFTVLMGIVFGIATALCAIFNMKALECGPLSYTKIIISCSMIIPALSGMLFFEEEAISAWQYIGIMCMVVSFVCAVDKKDEKSGASFQWLLFCLGAFAFCGSVGIMQKIHQSSAYREEFGVFLIIAFMASTMLSLCAAFACRIKTGERITLLDAGQRRGFWGIVLLCGIGIAFCNAINIYLSGVIDAILLFPVLNGGSMLLTSAAGFLLWKEKFSRKQYVGLALGILAIFLLCVCF